MIDLKSKVSGFYKIEVVRPDGTVRYSSEFPNLITDGGLVQMTNIAVDTILSKCHVGTSNTTPVYANTQLGTLVATANALANYYGCSSVAPYFVWQRTNFNFIAGIATGNLSEVGIGASATALFSRALITDDAGVPTTITILADEELNISYELRYYAPATDATGSITLGGISYGYTCRAANVTTAISGNSSYSGCKMSSSYMAYVNNNTISYNAYVSISDILAVTTAPSLDTYLITTPTITIGTLQVDHKFNWPTNAGNIAGGIRSMVFLKGYMPFQIQFEPRIPKTVDNSLSLTLRHTWGRF